MDFQDSEKYSNKCHKVCFFNKIAQKSLKKV